MRRAGETPALLIATVVHELQLDDVSRVGAKAGF